MVRHSIDGLDKVIRTEVEPPKVLLVAGPPGSMKTSFCYAVMSAHLRKTNEFGLYTTLEETVKSHLKNMDSLGIELSLNMQISDFTDLRVVDQISEPPDQIDYLEFTEKMIIHFKELHGDRFTLFTLDSLGALYSLMEDVSQMRKRMFYFFKMLRDYDLVSFVIMEAEIGGQTQLLGNEGFLVDGIIHLGFDRSRGKLMRYLQVEKLRACEHSVEKHALEVRKGSLGVLGPIFTSGD